MAKRKTKKKATTTRKKTTARRTTTKKKTTTRRRAASAEPKARTKSQIFTEISDITELPRRDVAAVFDAMQSLIKKDLGRSGPGQFTVPGLLKVKKIRRERRPAKKNVPNPFRPGELMDVKARPAHNVVKVRALKALKDMV